MHEESRKPLSRETLGVIPVIPEELDDFETQATRFRKGELDNGEFLPYRLRRGVYGQRQADALGLVAESALAADLDRGTAGDRYQVVLHVDPDTLRAEGGDREPDVSAETRPGPADGESRASAETPPGVAGRRSHVSAEMPPSADDPRRRPIACRHASSLPFGGWGGGRRHRRKLRPVIRHGALPVRPLRGIASARGC